MVRGLSSARSHDLWATLEGHGEARKTVTVGPDTTSSVTLALQQETATVLIATEPSGSAIRLDNKFSGTSPWSVALDLGRHGIAVSRSGYVKAETTLTVTKQTGPLQITLLPEPLGILVIKGNKPGDMWIDGGLVVSNVPNSGKQKLPPGSHTIRVVFPNGNTLERQVSIHSGERTTYDYSNGTLESVPEGRP
ncbi:MAG: PEGA domain-containing protein [Candidatus Eisenbacteria bacterium]|uniref:PEGA domain-containing protein n=1 Tax=Eiseniibacteriota bacterium TaxID=2212470 RepID=A0A538U8D6_UNCEI|nr:MAG: PEGA domain-containing protein [Candidatus Eisenbacteria bacterium]